MSEPVVRIDSLTRDFGSARVLNGVSCSISSESGIVALLGPNGAGKTTLMSILAGLLEPTSGHAEVCGHAAFPPHPDAGSLVAVLLDGCEPQRGRKVEELLRLRQSADPQFELNQAVNILQDHSITKKLRWHTLSKGQRRLVLAVLAICGGARVLLLDEPADGLDPSVRKTLYALLRQRVDERGAVAIVASHILSDIDKLADRILLLSGGTIRLDDDLETLRDEVAEVELTAPLPDDGLPANVDILHHQPDGTGTRLWLRYRGGSWSQPEHRLPNERVRRGVGLEALYEVLMHDHLQQQPEAATSSDGRD